MSLLGRFSPANEKIPPLTKISHAPTGKGDPAKTF